MQSFTFTGVTFSFLPPKIIHMWLFCSPNPRLCRRDLVFSPLLQMFQIFNQALFRAWFIQVLHCLTFYSNTSHSPPCGDVKHSSPIFIFICSLISFGLDGSVETSKSDSSRLLLTVVPGHARSAPKQETRQVFYFGVAFYFLLALYTQLQPSKHKLCTAGSCRDRNACMLCLCNATGSRKHHFTYFSKQTNEVVFAQEYCIIMAKNTCKRFQHYS